MAKSDKGSAAESERSQCLERLTAAVDRLADEVRVVRDVLDEIREDLGWVTRNGVPLHPIVHTQLLRMARDPLVPDANERLDFRRFVSADSSLPELASDMLDELVSEIAEVVTGTGQEQVNLLLGALDDMRTKLVAAIKLPPVESKPAATAVPHSSVPSASRHPAKQRDLF